MGTDPREDIEVFDRGRLGSHDLRFDATRSTLYFLSGDVWWRTTVYRQTLDRA